MGLCLGFCLGLYLAVCSRMIRKRRATTSFGAACLLATCCLMCCLMGQGVRADTTLWQCGVADDSAAEFGDYPNAPVTKVSVPDAPRRQAHQTKQTGQTSQASSRDVPRGLKADADPVLEIAYGLRTVPRNGAQFAFKLLDAPASGAEMAVFSNGVMAGMIQLWGTSGTSSPYKWKKTYRLYVPREMLRPGRNVLRLEATRPLWTPESVDHHSVDSRLWCEWDFLRLVALSRPAAEPVQGTVAYLGTTLKHGQFFVNDDTLRLAPVVLPWLGIAYSGNTIRADFWQDVASQQPRRLEYLKLLRDLNMTVVVDHISGSHFHNDAAGRMPPQTRAALDDFFARYGGLFQFYELGNEPCMFGGGLAETLEVAHYLGRIKPPHVQLVAPGWAYGGGKGTPVNWDADPANRRQVEALCQLTNGHSYGYSYADNRGGSFVENLNTLGGVRDGWPRPYLNTETGTNNWHSEENGPRLASTQSHAQAFDRILRAHLAVVDRTMQHAAIFDDFGLFQMPASFADLSSLTASPGINDEDGRVQTFRRLALAYATHGAPLPFLYQNRAEMVGRHVLFRGVNTASLSPLPGSGGKSDKVLLNFVSFENTPQRMRVRVTLPQAGRYTGDRFGPGQTYAEAHSRLTIAASRTVDLDVTLPPRESVQYILRYIGKSTLPPPDRAHDHLVSRLKR